VSNQAWLNIMPGQIVQVEIDSRRYWNCATVWLESEGRYDFEIQGNQHWVDFYRCVDAKGYNIAVLQNARWARRNPRFNWFALVGCIERVSSSEFLIGRVEWTTLRRKVAVFSALLTTLGSPTGTTGEA
jgi:hypothetical protein